MFKNRETEIIVDQGDVFENLSYLKYLKIDAEGMDYDQMDFDKIIVLSQTCDLHREFENKEMEILSVLVAPMFLREDFQKGTHLGELKKLDPVNNKLFERYTKNEHPRYHVVELDMEINEEKLVQEYIIDFRYFCTIDITNFSKENYISSLEIMRKELLTQRFSNYLSRIGIPTK